MDDDFDNSFKGVALGETGIPVLLFTEVFAEDLPRNIRLLDNGFEFFVGDEKIATYEGFAPEVMTALQQNDEIPISEVEDPEQKFDIVTSIAYKME